MRRRLKYTSPRCLCWLEEEDDDATYWEEKPVLRMWGSEKIKNCPSSHFSSRPYLKQEKIWKFLTTHHIPVYLPFPDALDFACVERFSQLFCPGSCLGVTVQVVVFAYNASLIPSHRQAMIWKIAQFKFRAKTRATKAGFITLFHGFRRVLQL